MPSIVSGLPSLHETELAIALSYKLSIRWAQGQTEN